MAKASYMASTNLNYSNLIAVSSMLSSNKLINRAETILIAGYVI